MFWVEVGRLCVFERGRELETGEVRYHRRCGSRIAYLLVLVEGIGRSNSSLKPIVGICIFLGDALNKFRIL